MVAQTQIEQRTKVVVRHLPPYLEEEGFRELISEWLDKIDYFRFVKGKKSAKETIYSRAYLRFVDPQDVLRFTHVIHGHAFVTDRGTQFRSSVEFAPYQKVPKSRTKRDSRQGTLEKDADYQAFLERLQAGPAPLPSAESQLSNRDGGGAGLTPAGAATLPSSGDASAGDAGVTVTALMQYLKDKRSQPKVAVVGKAGRREGGRGQQAATAAAAAAAGGGGQKQKGGGKQRRGAEQAQQAQQQAPKLLQAADRKAQQAQQQQQHPASAGAKPKKGAAASKAQQGQQAAAVPPKQLLTKKKVVDAEAGPPPPKAKQKAAPPERKKVLRRGDQQAEGGEGGQGKGGRSEGGEGGARAAPEPEPAAAAAAGHKGGDASATTQAGAAGGSTGEEGSRQRPARPLRTRAGWGVYQPKRVGRLMDEEAGG